jgi:hypothetical protein
VITEFCSRLKKSFNYKDIMIIIISFIIVVFWLVPSSWVSFTPLYLPRFTFFCQFALFIHERRNASYPSFSINYVSIYIYNAQQFYLNCMFISLIHKFFNGYIGLIFYKWLYWPNILQMVILA